MLSTSFRNTLIASTLLVGASILVSPAAFAGSVSDDDSVSGTIQPINEVVFTGRQTVSNLTPGQASTPAFLMGSVHVHNNHGSGWTLSAASANAGKLQYTHAATSNTYSISYTNLAVATAPGQTSNTPFASPTATAAQVVGADYSAGAAAGVDLDVTATIGDVGHPPAGTYTDTITFTLTSP